VGKRWERSGKEVGKKWERSGEAEFSKMQPSAIWNSELLDRE
jgi:hypothetical protein